jgi:hypothetical protein
MGTQKVPIFMKGAAEIIYGFWFSFPMQCKRGSGFLKINFDPNHPGNLLFLPR